MRSMSAFPSMPTVTPQQSGWTGLGAAGVAGSMGFLTWRANRKHRALRRRLAHAKVEKEFASGKEKAAAQEKINSLERQIALAKKRLHWYLGTPTGLASILALTAGGHAGYHYITNKKQSSS